MDAVAVGTGDLSAGLVDEGRSPSFVILRRESEPVNTKPGDGCCGVRFRSGRAGVDGGGRRLVDGVGSVLLLLESIMINGMR